MWPLILCGMMIYCHKTTDRIVQVRVWFCHNNIKYEVVTYRSIGTLSLSVIDPSTQCACANYSSLARISAQIWRPGCIVVTFGLKVRDAFDSFEDVQLKIKVCEDRTAAQL